MYFTNISNVAIDVDGLGTFDVLKNLTARAKVSEVTTVVAEEKDVLSSTSISTINVAAPPDVNVSVTKHSKGMPLPLPISRTNWIPPWGVPGSPRSR